MRRTIRTAERRHEWHAGSGATWDLSSNALRPAGWTSADAAGTADLPGTRSLRRGGDPRRDQPRVAVYLPDTRKAYVSPARHWASSQTSTVTCRWAPG
jgi:hypothetical protein